MIQVVSEVKTGYPCLAICLLVSLNDRVRSGRRSGKYTKHHNAALASRMFAYRQITCHRFFFHTPSALSEAE